MSSSSLISHRERSVKAVSEPEGRAQEMFKKVMAVDDSELIHNMYRLMMKKYEGCDLVSAKNGKEALDRLDVEGDVDLILLDINMPVMNGIQFIEKVKKSERHAHIPVVIVSTEGKEEDTLRGLRLGAAGYIVKPFKSVTLYNLIDSLRKKQAAAGA